MSKKSRTSSSFSLLLLAKPYLWLILLVFLINLFVNGLNLAVPKIIASAIDTFQINPLGYHQPFILLSAIVVLIFLISVFQTIIQTYLSEKIGRDLRNQLITKISTQQFSFVGEITPEKLLTNLTGDVDNIKQVISLGLVQVFSSIVLILGAGVLLFTINPSLALLVLTIIPLIIITFFLIFSKISIYFKKAQANIDKLNKTINESIVASSLIRILNSQSVEIEKFDRINSESRTISMAILKMFASLIPLISIIANFGIVAVMLVGGRAIVFGTFTIGGFTAFLSYISMLIFPIIVIGFISNLFARAAASFDRVVLVLGATSGKPLGGLDKKIDGSVEFKNVTLSFGDKTILKDISFSVAAGSRTAILGPTAAGKTQIFYLLSGLLKCTSGTILIDNIPQPEYSSESLSDQLGLVFQDSSIFNTTIKENINFKNVDNEILLEKAINTAELQDFIQSLPDGIETKIAERGASLSGGQKQRLTLARALVVNPKILLLDDFTARVDQETEKRIFKNIKNNYPDITQILITQQINSVMDFDQIILVMEGELLAVGTHSELLQKSPEYQQIYNSQLTTSK